MQAADFKNSLAENYNSKRLTDVPKFYGNAKDTLTAWEFLKRLEQAAAGLTKENAQSSAICYIPKPTGS